MFAGAGRGTQSSDTQRGGGREGSLAHKKRDIFCACKNSRCVRRLSEKKHQPSTAAEACHIPLAFAVREGDNGGGCGLSSLHLDYALESKGRVRE